MIPRVSFVDPEVVDFALQIPAEYKLRNNVEKWILRQAVSDLLPDEILNRTKAKFWEGGGVEDLLARYADTQVSDRDFENERTLPNGWTLNTKEELLYFRIFKEHFGELTELSWMGRTKGAPVT
jgi:asparagine synthase (glutamine-hydrolysing)